MARNEIPTLGCLLETNVKRFLSCLILLVLSMGGIVGFSWWIGHRPPMSAAMRSNERVQKRLRVLFPTIRVWKVLAINADTNTYVVLCSDVGSFDFIPPDPEDRSTRVLRGDAFAHEFETRGELRVKSFGDRKLLGVMTQMTKSEVSQGLPWFDKVWNHATGDDKTSLPDDYLFAW